MPAGSVSVVVLSLILWVTSAWAQPWSGILDPSRAIDWSQAGAGTIPTRPVVCSTLSPLGGDDSTQINNALSACPAGQTVKLSAGTFLINTTGVTIRDQSSITLRGAGPHLTKLVFAASALNGCGPPNGGSYLCVSSHRNFFPPPGSTDITIANWTAGFAQGTTVITLSATTNLVVGSSIILDQLNDDTVDPWPTFPYICGNNSIDVNVCCIGCSSGTGRAGRAQLQIVTVVAINGFNVTISPGLYMTNWRVGKTPQAWWPGSPFSTGVGVEDLTLDATADTAGNGFSVISFMNMDHSWIKNVRSIGGPFRRGLMGCYQCHHLTVRDSYIYGGDPLDTSNPDQYGFYTFMGSDNLIENNIYQHVSQPTISDGGGHGTVFAYNYSIDGWLGTNLFTFWQQGSAYSHGPGDAYFLWEGNDGVGFEAENFHGTHNLLTGFRNRWHGLDRPQASQQTVPFFNYDHERYMNAIGNVLGTAGYHTNYTSQAGGSTANCNVSIYALGWGGNCASSTGPADDLHVAESLMRWGNYDVVNNAVRFVAGEVPSGLTALANAVPASQALPASFYLASKPTVWWGTPWDPIGGIPYPAIGPDVTGGNVSAGTGAAATLGGHAWKIPARLCFENTAVDPAYPVNATTGSQPRLFNAVACYTGSAVQPPPSAPSRPVRLFIAGIILALAFYAYYGHRYVAT